MELGTVVYQNEIYNLDYMTSSEISELFGLVEQKTKEENSILSAKLRSVYNNRLSTEIINQKVKNQLNSMKASILIINSKFNEKSKNYDMINEGMLHSLKDFETVLKRFANTFDIQMQKLIYQRLESELKLLVLIEKENVWKAEKNSLLKKIKKGKNKQKSSEISDCIVNLKKEIKEMTKKLNRLAQQKQDRIFSAMEVGNNELVIGVKKRRKIKNIAKFFSYKFNTYKVIQKNVIEPFQQRIDEFKVNKLKKIDEKLKEFDFAKIEEKIDKIVKSATK